MTPEGPRTWHPAARAARAVARLAFNLRWVWNHATDRVWEAFNAEVWLQTRNPILVIQNTPRSRFDELAHDADFVERVRRLDRQDAEYLSRPSWFQQACALDPPPLTAYFSMEYGITDALPLYSGGLGVLAGDHLKTASDLGVPLVAVGLFYREGYFRQMLDADGSQLEIYAVNSRESLPVRLVTDAEGTPLRVTIEARAATCACASGGPTSAACRSTCSTATTRSIRRSTAASPRSSTPATARRG